MRIWIACVNYITICAYLFDSRGDGTCSAGPRQHSHSWFRVPRGSWTYFTVSRLWEWCNSRCTCYLDDRVNFTSLGVLCYVRYWKQKTWTLPMFVCIYIMTRRLKAGICEEYDRLLGSGSLKRILISTKIQQRLPWIQGNLGITRRFRCNGTGHQKTNCFVWWLLFGPPAVMTGGAFVTSGGGRLAGSRWRYSTPPPQRLPVWWRGRIPPPWPCES
jgi:hypothetical protein